MKEFSHHDFSIGLPPRWIDSTVVVLAGPPNEGYSPNITVTREQLEFRLSVEEYAAEQLIALRQGLAEKSYKVLEEGPLSLGPAGAFQRVHRFEVEEEGLRITQLQIYLVRGGEALTITCTHRSEWFEQLKPQFMEAARMFHWREAGA
jgi:hypothetical protein